MCDSESSLVHTTSQTETQPDHARDQAPYYLIIEKIRPGDVLLTRGTTPRASLIAYGTKGRYSHAALWVIPKEGAIPILMEADSVGVGPTFLPTVTLTGPDGLPIFAYALGDLEAISLLRHPWIQNLDAGIVSEVTEELIEDVWSRRYSALVRLSDMLDTSYLRGPARKLFAAIDAVNRDPRGHQGVLCSELVAMYFERLSLPLFQGRPPSAMSPNHLAEAASGLQPVTDAIIDSEAARFMTKAASSALRPTRKEWLGPLVKGRHRHEVMTAATDRLTDTLQSIRDQWISLAIDSSQHMTTQMQAAIRQAVQARDQIYLEKFCKHTCTQVFLNHLLVVLQQNSQGDQNEDNPSYRTAAHQYLTDLFKALNEENTHTFLRAQHLFALSLARDHKENGSSLSKRQIISTRRKLLNQWRKYCEDRLNLPKLVDPRALHTCPTHSELIYRDTLLAAALAGSQETSRKIGSDFLSSR